jgi:hypothetical protein
MIRVEKVQLRPPLQAAHEARDAGVRGMQGLARKVRREPTGEVREALLHANTQRDGDADERGTPACPVVPDLLQSREGRCQRFLGGGQAVLAQPGVGADPEAKLRVVSTPEARRVPQGLARDDQAGAGVLGRDVGLALITEDRSRGLVHCDKQALRKLATAFRRMDRLVICESSQRR